MAADPNRVVVKHTLGIVGKSVEEAVRILQAKAEGLNDPRVSSERVGYSDRRLYLTGWRVKTADEIAAEEKARQAAIDRKAEAAATQKARAAARAAQVAIDSVKHREAEKRAAKKQADALVSILREAGYEVTRKKGSK